MPDGLVGEAKGVVDRSLRADHQHVARRQVLAEPLGLQRFGLLLQAEGARRRDLAAVVEGRRIERHGLAADAVGVAAVVEFVDHLKARPIGRQGGDHAVALLDHDRLADPEDAPRRVQLDDARADDRIDERHRRAVAAGQFRAVQPDDRVVDPKTRQRREAVLDGVDARLAFAKRRASSAGNRVLDRRRDPDRRIEIGPLEDDAAVGRGGEDPRLGHRAAKQAATRDEHL